MDNQSGFGTWKRSIYPTIATVPLPKERHPKINWSNDTAWQQKGSGHTHNLPWATLWCLDTRLVNHCCTKWRVRFAITAVHSKKGTLMDVPPHDCCKNQDGSSRQMEPDLCLELIVLLCNKFECIVNLLCCDDDSSMRAHCQWSNEVFLANNLLEPNCQW